MFLAHFIFPIFSLASGFSPVGGRRIKLSRFNGFARGENG
jgi:hypothetical protein